MNILFTAKVDYVVSSHSQSNIMSWPNSWSSTQPPGLAPGYPPPMPSTQTVPASAPVPNYGVSSDQYNQWQWQQYQQQYAQWYALYGEKYAQQTGSTLPPVASPMPQTMPSVIHNPYLSAPPAVSTFTSISMTAPPPPSEPHPDELKLMKNRQKPPLPEEKSAEEIAFDVQFRKWEEEFETWKRTNINHPDKAAYTEYEQKYEDQRKKLLDHREQLRRKRIGQTVGTHSGVKESMAVTLMQPPPPPPSQATQAGISNLEVMNNGSREANISGKEKTRQNIDNAVNNLHLQNVFNYPANGGIPGLDLITESPPVPKKARIDENVINLVDDEAEAPPNVDKPCTDNMISSLLNDPNVNALLQLVGKTISGNGQNVNIGGTANSLVAALAQLTNNTNLGNQNNTQQSSVKSPNCTAAGNGVQTNVSRLVDTCSEGTNIKSSKESQSCNITQRSAESSLQYFNPRVPPPPLDIDLSRPPPSIRPSSKSNREQFDKKTEQLQENGSFNGRYSIEGTPLPKIPRFDRPPPPLATRAAEEYEIDPELGRPVAVPKPDWMTEEEYQEIYDRFEHVQSFDERKNKMEFAIQMLKQHKAREGMLPPEEQAGSNQTRISMPKPLVKTEEKIKSTEDFFQPQQVFDYSNCRNMTEVGHKMVAGRIIDYDHRGVSQNNANINNRFVNRRQGFRHMDKNKNLPEEGNENGLVSSTHRFDYNHSRVGNVSNIASADPAQLRQKWQLSNHPPSTDRSVSGIEKLAQMHLNPNPDESNPNYPSKFLLMNDNRPNCLSTKRGKRPSSIRKQKLKQIQQQKSNSILPANICKQEMVLALEDLSSDDGNEENTTNEDHNIQKGTPLVKQEPTDERPESEVSSLSSQNAYGSQMVDIDDLLLPPGRYSRPSRICLLIRGLPGSGKSYLARLIKNKEQSFSSSPRVLSLDDYFLVDKENEEIDEVTGKKVKSTHSLYEFDKDMEDIYIQNLIKAFKRTISERLFNFVIVDCCNHQLEIYCEFHNYARSNGFKVYTCTMQTDVEDCARQNIHGRTAAEIQVYADDWAMAPDEHVQINFSSLFVSEIENLSDTNTTIVDMELAAPEEESIAEKNVHQFEHVNTALNESNEDCPEVIAESELFASKWDHDASEQNLAKLDGISKPLKRQPTLEDYLQLDSDLEDDDECRDSVEGCRKKKRVRWADIEEQKAQKKMRDLGFVVGATNWSRMMDPTEGSSALTQTRYIARERKQS
ncbi:uncharacterized protein LOC128721110 [Anopheles nili]|uniref:uncharacterized protein LOC128721110 n=1 Tax=Anopheles nili TaxID=185578 RepID=UPI00237A1256|nr:uncharacterized protein LOC128721110 [Anopheles nili]